MTLLLLNPASAQVIFDHDFSGDADGSINGAANWNGQAPWTIASGRVVHTPIGYSRAENFAAFAPGVGDVVEITITDLIFDGAGAGAADIYAFGFASSPEHSGAVTPQVQARLQFDGTNLNFGGASIAYDAADSTTDPLNPVAGDSVNVTLSYTRLESGEWDLISTIDNTTDATSNTGAAITATNEAGQTAGSAGLTVAEYLDLDISNNVQFGMRGINNTGGTISLAGIKVELLAAPDPGPDLGVETVIFDDTFNLISSEAGGIANAANWVGQPAFTINADLNLETTGTSYSRAERFASFAPAVGESVEVTLTGLVLDGAGLGATGMYAFGIANEPEHTGANTPQVQAQLSYDDVNLSIGGASIPYTSADTTTDPENPVAGDSVNIRILYTRLETGSWSLYTTIDNVTTGGSITGVTVGADANSTGNIGDGAGLTVSEYLDADPANNVQFGMRGVTGPGGPTMEIEGIAVSLFAAPIPDPLLTLQSGDLEFGSIFHEDGLSSTSKTLTFVNDGATQNLVIDALAMTIDAGGIYSVSTTETLPLTLAPGETFDVEVTATGGGANAYYEGELLVDTTPDDQDSSIAASASISTTGDLLSLVVNPTLDNGLAAWGGNSVATDGLGSTGGARVPGRGDDRSNTSTVFASNLNQSFEPGGFGDFDLEFTIVVPDFSEFTGISALGSALDRSFNVAVMADGELPTDGNFTDTHGDDTLINLLYFPDGSPSNSTEGFYVYDRAGGNFELLADLGTLTPSTGANTDGTPPSTALNIHKIKIEGRGFGTGSPSYNVLVSDANSSTYDRSLTSNVAFFRGADATTRTAAAVNFTTADDDGSETSKAGAYQPSFWVDDIAVTVPGVTQPTILFGSEVPAGAPKFIPGMSKELFTVTATGASGTLDISAASFGNSDLSLASPALPISIPVGTSQVFEVLTDGATSAGLITDTVTLTTTDTFNASQTVDIKLRVFASTDETLIDFDDGLLNGEHDASIRNGGFEDGFANDTVDATPSWATKDDGDTSTELLTLDADPATGSLHGQTAGWNGGSLNIPVQDLSADEWTLEEGDYFTVEFKWKAGANFDTVNDTLNVVMFGMLPDGSLINPVEDRPITFADTTDQTASYNQVSFVSTPLAADAAANGNGLRFLIEVAQAADHFALIDDVTLIGHFSDGSASVTRTQITGFMFDDSTNTVTLNWTDEGGDYSIQANDDLNWESPTAIPLDGSETITDGEYEFEFIDAGATGSKRFWRVVE